MRLRLFHKFTLVLTILMAMTVLAIAGVMIRNLNMGFSTYLDERDREQLKVFATVVRDAMAQGKAPQTALTSNFPALLDEQAKREGPIGHRPKEDAPPEVGPPGPPPDFPPPEMGGDAGADERHPRPDAPRNGHPPPRAGVDTNGYALPTPNGEGPGSGFGNRVSVLSADGKVLAGAPTGTGSNVFEEPVTVNGKLVARVQLLKLHRPSEELDDRFLRNQYVGIAIVSSIVFVVGLGSILVFTRGLVARLHSAQSATALIARGTFNVRLSDGANDEVSDLVRDINSMASSLERLEQARRKWLAQLSHELRTPLTVLQGECEAMIDGIRPVSVESVAALHDRVLALKRIVEDLHTVSLADLGALSHDFAEADATQLIGHVLARGEARLSSHGLTVRFESAAESIPVHWDARRIEQLLENLLENTIRYTDAPGNLRVYLAAGSETVTLRWEDSAPGVSTTALGQLFEPLFQADSERSHKAGGSGLGLAICRAIVMAHSGRIEAESSRLGGVCIVITLPVDPTAYDRRS